MWDARRDMDHIEKIAVRQTIEQTVRSAEFMQAQRTRLSKLLRSPYFGRFDFDRLDDPANPVCAYYIGVHHFHDEASGNTLVYDWRAPVASLFYDYEIGPARYESPGGTISGHRACTG